MHLAGVPDLVIPLEELERHLILAESGAEEDRQGLGSPVWMKGAGSHREGINLIGVAAARPSALTARSGRPYSGRGSYDPPGRLIGPQG